MASPPTLFLLQKKRWAPLGGHGSVAQPGWEDRFCPGAARAGGKGGSGE